MRSVGPVQKKILLLLLGGLTLMIAGSARRQWKIMKEIRREWNVIDRQTLKRSANKLYKAKLVRAQDNPDGTTTLMLSDCGKKLALTYNIETINIKKPNQWDGKWRIVISDVPERLKKLREALRFHIKSLGFYSLQKSVFVHPFDCQKEIEFIREWYHGEKYVKFIVAHSIDDEPALKKHFGLI